MNCPYCNGKVSLQPGRVVYRSDRYGNVWICESYPDCDAYVGAHRKTNQPKGTLANAELREWRGKAHAAFDPIWQTGRMKRKQAYRWLANNMDIEADKAHIGMFGVEKCKQVIEICLSSRMS